MRLLPLQLVVPVVIVAVAVALVATMFGAPVYAAVAGGVCIVVAGLTRVRGRALARFLTDPITFRWQTFRRNSSPTLNAAFDVPLPEGGSHGLRWHDDCLVAMLRIDSAPRPMTLLSPGTLRGPDRDGAEDAAWVVPLPEIARCLAQFDIDLASIDVISTGSRTFGADTVARLYDQVLGPLPAIAHRTVWIVLHFDPSTNPRAVRSRGGGPAGALRAASMAAKRVANRLAAKGFSISALSAAEMDAAVEQLTNGATIETLVESPRSVEHNGIHFTSYQVDPELIGSADFTRVWATPSLATTLTVRLRPATARGAGAARPHRSADPAQQDRIAVSVLARFDTARELTEAPMPGLQPLPGKQYQAFLDSLPIGAPRLELGAGCGKADELAAVALPTAGCGQLIGADESGHGVAVPLVGYQMRRVEIIGGLQLAQQVILRAIALGAKVVVHTDRHEAWRTMVTNIDAPQTLSIAAAWSAAVQQARSPRGVNVIVFDGKTAGANTANTTTIVLRTADSAQPDAARVPADVTLTQRDGTTNLVDVQTTAGKITVRMVATPGEMRYIGVA